MNHRAMNLTTAQHQFFDWLDKSHPNLARRFWASQSGGGMGAATAEGIPPASSNWFADRLEELQKMAGNYYEYDLQKRALEEEARRAIANQPPSGNYPGSPIQTGFGISPTTGALAIAGLVGLWFLSKKGKR